MMETTRPSKDLYSEFLETRSEPEMAPMSPEEEAECRNYIEILTSLSGDPKYNFFHMRHFKSEDNQIRLLEMMAAADEEAAEWQAAMEAKKEAAWLENEKLYRESTRAIEAGLGKLAAHPKPLEREGRMVEEKIMIGGYKSELDGKPIFFRLVTTNDQEETPYLSIEFPQEPTSFDPDSLIPIMYDGTLLEGREPRSALLAIAQRDPSKRFVRVGERLEIQSRKEDFSPRYGYDGLTKSTIIDEQGSDTDSFIDASSARDRSLPMPIRYRSWVEGPYSTLGLVPNSDDYPDSERLSQYIECIDKAEPAVE
jgi:hypothetical protein